MRFPSVGACLRWYGEARQGNPRAARLTDLHFRTPQHTRGDRLAVLGDIGKALQVLPDIEKAVLVLRHVEHLPDEAIARKLSRTFRRRFIRRTVADLLREGEIALEEEFERRGLLGDVDDVQP